MADIAASVLAKLRNKAKASGISYQQCLQLFVQEEFLRKLSKSGCEDTLILKGGLFIYTLTNFGGFRKQLELKKFKLFFLCIMHKEEGEENDKPRVVQSKQKEIM